MDGDSIVWVSSFGDLSIRAYELLGLNYLVQIYSYEFAFQPDDIKLLFYMSEFYSCFQYHEVLTYDAYSGIVWVYGLKYI